VIAAPAECAAAIGAAWDGSASTVHPIRELSDLGVAAYGAGLRPPEKTLILTPARRAVVLRRARRREAAYGLLAGVLIVLCAQLYLGLLRARAEVVGERRAHIRPAVEQALHVRDRIEGVSQRVSALKRLHDRRSRSIVLFERLARALPNDAHLTSLRLDGSGLRVEGRARSATALVPVFQAAPWVRSVHLGSPLRREVLGGRTWERFSITLVLAAPDSARGAERP
jgi:Tfp pilus assembly protein PilN